MTACSSPRSSGFHQRHLAELLMREGASLADPSRVDIRGRVRTGSDVFVDVNVVFEGEVVLGDRVSIGPGCVIRDAVIEHDTEILANCVIDDARVGVACRIGPFARLRPDAELARGVRIGNFVEVKKAVMGEGSKANHLTYIGDSRIGRDVNVGAGVVTCNYDGASKHTTVIEDNVFIGSGSMLVAPVTLHEGATIGAGSIIGKDAPPGALTVTRVQQRSIKAGSVRARSEIPPPRTTTPAPEARKPRYASGAFGPATLFLTGWRETSARRPCPTSFRPCLPFRPEASPGRRPSSASPQPSPRS